MPAEAQRIPLRAAAPAGAREARWIVDGEPVAVSEPSAPALWQPAGVGLHRVALVVDGEPAGSVTVEVRGHPEPAPR
jgi:membrane carboxypeptidase/penicillin-binding protein PbpC